MAEQNAKVTLNHEMVKGVCCKVLKTLQKNKIIKKFKKCHSLSEENALCFELVIGYKLCLRLTIYKSEKQGVEIWDDRFLSLAIKVDYNLQFKDLYYPLRKIIVLHSRGKLAEKIYKARMERICKRHKYIKEIKKTEPEDDKKGIDFLILYKDCWVPIQIKTNKFFQLLHIKKHPETPSSLFDVNCTNRKLISDTNKICYYFSKKKSVVIHI